MTKIPKKVLDETEDQLYRLRNEMSDVTGTLNKILMMEVNSLIDKIQAYRQRFYHHNLKLR